MSWDAELSFAHELADLADDLTFGAFGTDRARPDHKADGTPVTAADRDTEAALRRAIVDRHPDHAVLGEEDGLIGPEDAPRWIIDPIDGTSNFVAAVGERDRHPRCRRVEAQAGDPLRSLDADL
ncbi:MAG: inositol monophosphatase family protein, partial [Nitriliruptorales bacterium]|nr:inositol monophosphatase family protein [Nitriliruptorales bacterium]